MEAAGKGCWQRHARRFSRLRCRGWLPDLLCRAFSCGHLAGDSPVREISRNGTRTRGRVLRSPAVRLCRHDADGFWYGSNRDVPRAGDDGAEFLCADGFFATRAPMALHFDPFTLQILPLLAFVLIAVGLLFKVAAVPFHMWAPDVYEGAPTPVTAYVSVASKTASFALLLRLFLVVFSISQATWIYLIAGVAVASLTWGNLAALTQTNVKRLLAYSSISHVGYILLGLVAGNETGLVGIAYYLFAYVFMTAGAFAVIIVLRQKGLMGEELEDLNGLYQRSPAAAVLLLIFMLSLAGIPPTAGFMGKYFIFLSLIESKHPVLAVFAVLYIVPALYYYFRIIVHAWLKQPGEAPRAVMTNAQAVALGVTVFVTLAAGLYPEPFTRLARYAFGL